MGHDVNYSRDSSRVVTDLPRSGLPDDVFQADWDIRLRTLGREDDNLKKLLAETLDSFHKSLASKIGDCTIYHRDYESTVSQLQKQHQDSIEIQEYDRKVLRFLKDTLLSDDEIIKTYQQQEIDRAQSKVDERTAESAMILQRIDEQQTRKQRGASDLHKAFEARIKFEDDLKALLVQAEEGMLDLSASNSDEE